MQRLQVCSQFLCINRLSVQKKLIRTYCLWQTLCIFQPVLAFVKSEKRGRPHVCVCGGAKLLASTLELYCSLTVNIPTQKSKIVKLCVKLQSGLHEAIFICWVQPCKCLPLKVLRCISVICDENSFGSVHRMQN